jgi:hypothetical protein
MTTIKSCHTKACFEAWVKCENLLTDLYSYKNLFSAKVLKVVDECALICMGTFHALKAGSVNINKMALLCVGICEECAEICESQYGEEFHKCAKICRECSNTLSDFSLSA